MTWVEFNYLGPIAAALWLLAGLLSFKNKKWLTDLLMSAGIILFAFFIILFWLKLKRPPLRTMGETRLWYSFFLAAFGFWVYKHWRFNWALIFSAVVATVFVLINLLKPEIHSITLMPALQSYYFIPHVTVYILAYAMLGLGTISGLILLYKGHKAPEVSRLKSFSDNAIYVGLGFLMLGLLSGALWAKDAWGHYWSWDPKETWAFITAAAYLLYVHLRLRNIAPCLTFWVLPLAFVLLMITWLGVSYLPSAQESVHMYGV